MIWASALNTHLDQYDGHLEKLTASLLIQRNQQACITLRKAPRATRPRSSEATVVTDGNAFFYSIGKAAKTFKYLASNIFDMMPNTPKIHFSTDMYKKFSEKKKEVEEETQML